MIAVLIGNVLGAAFLAAAFTVWNDLIDSQWWFVRFLASFAAVLICFAWQKRGGK